MESRIVEVRPVPKEKWHGKTGKDDFAAPVVIEAAVSGTTGQYATGLSEEDRKRLEKVTKYDLSPEYQMGTPHPFWSSPAGAVKLEYKTNIFDVSKALDEIKISILKASDLVANSMKEYQDGKFPNAIFVIFDEREETEIKASKLALKNKVVIECAKLTPEKKAELVQILEGISVRKMSAQTIDLKLDEAIDKYGAEKVINLLKRDAKRNTVHALVLEAIYKNVLRKEGSAIYYMDDQLGFDVESAVDYFLDPRNQTLKAQILEKIV